MAEGVNNIVERGNGFLGGRLFPQSVRRSRFIILTKGTRFLHSAQPITDRLVQLRDDIADESKGGV